MTEPERAPADEARAFALAFRSFLEWIHEDQGEGRRNPIVALVQGHLGDRVEQSVLRVELPVFEHVNLQVALDAWTVAAGRTVASTAWPSRRTTNRPRCSIWCTASTSARSGCPRPSWSTWPSGPDRTTACLRRAILLVEDDRGRYVVMVVGPQLHQEPVLAIEIAGLPTPAAQEVLRELAELRHRLNVYRGQVLELAAGHGGLSVTFPVLAPTARDGRRAARDDPAPGGAAHPRRRDLPGRLARSRDSTSSVGSCSSGRPARARPTQRGTSCSSCTAARS